MAQTADGAPPGSVTAWICFTLCCSNVSNEQMSLALGQPVPIAAWSRQSSDDSCQVSGARPMSPRTPCIWTSMAN